MKRIAILLCLLMPCGCGKVLGYYPTEAELDAIQRGEDPRSEEAPRPKDSSTSKDRPRDATGGLEGNGGKSTSGGAGEKSEEPRSLGPAQGVILRWVDCGMAIVEAEGKRERVRLPGVEVPHDFTEAADALNQRREDFPGGTKILLSYPEKSQDGKVTIYRNKDGDLLANIRKQ